MSTSGVPEEIWLEILIRLPVKSIFQCKCVSTSWCSLISSPNFVKSHLQLNKNKPSSNSLLFASHDDPYGGSEDMYSIGLDLLELSLTSKEIEDDFDLLEESSFTPEEIEDDYTVSMCYPFKSQVAFVIVLGSCNGLVLLEHTDIENYEFGDTPYGEVFFWSVWNPATGEYKKIPPSPDGRDKWGLWIHGLWYDGKNEDYKFVLGKRLRGTEVNAYVEVYSLRSNSWETIDAPCGFTYPEHETGVIVNGDLHLLAKTKHGACIVYLESRGDMPSSFKEIQLPLTPNLKFVSMGMLEEGCLCVVAHNGGRVEIWEMKVYGAPESWSKRCVISNEIITRAVVTGYVFSNGTITEAVEPAMKIVWSFKSGNIIFLDRYWIVLYDLKHGSATERELKRFVGFESVVSYVESLVSIGTITSGTERVKESDGRKSTQDSTDDESTEDEA